MSSERFPSLTELSADADGKDEKRATGTYIKIILQGLVDFVEDGLLVHLSANDLANSHQIPRDLGVFGVVFESPPVRLDGASSDIDTVILLADLAGSGQTAIRQWRQRILGRCLLLGGGPLEPAEEIHDGRFEFAVNWRQFARSW